MFGFSAGSDLRLIDLVFLDLYIPFASGLGCNETLKEVAALFPVRSAVVFFAGLLARNLRQSALIFE